MGESFAEYKALLIEAVDEAQRLVGGDSTGVLARVHKAATARKLAAIEKALEKPHKAFGVK